MNRYVKLKNNVITVIVESDATPVTHNDTWIKCNDAGIGWIYDGETFTAPEAIVIPEVAKTPEIIQAEIIVATQKRLDDFAKTRNYDSILSAATYAVSSIPKFMAEGQYAVDIRDLTWTALYDLLAEVLAGTTPMPASFADVEPLLPELIWPD